MLVLGRRLMQEIKLTGNITIQVVGLKKHQVKIGITAPPEINIWRAELPDETTSQGRKAERVKGDAHSG